jgi:CheY-like chemotaxis protein
MGQAQQKRRAVLIVEDDAELRSLMAALFEDTIECESAEAALATLLIGGREVAMIFADVRLRGVMDGIDLAREVRMRWPLLPVIPHLGASARARRPTSARCRLHAQAVAAAQRSDCRRTGAGIWARQLTSAIAARTGFEGSRDPAFGLRMLRGFLLWLRNIVTCRTLQETSSADHSAVAPVRLRCTPQG